MGCPGKKKPVSEQQRRWAHAAEERRELPKGTAHKWSKRVEGRNLPKVATVQGLFFEKRSQPRAGHFFRDLPGRDDGDFLSKGAMETKEVFAGQLGAGSSGTRADGKSGAVADQGRSGSSGVYGTGDGEPKSEDTKGREDDAERLRALLANAAGGTERKAEIEKTSAMSPSDWDADAGLPIGFHRAAKEPKEGNDGLEPGLERFHATDVKEPTHGAVTGVRHGLTESGALKALGVGQLGKHASVDGPPRFLGTKFGISKVAAKPKFTEAKEYAGETGKTYSESMGKLWRSGKQKAHKAVQSVAGDPHKAGIATLLGGMLGYKLLRGAGRKGMRLMRGQKKPQGLLQQAGGAISRLVGGK